MLAILYITNSVSYLILDSSSGKEVREILLNRTDSNGGVTSPFPHDKCDVTIKLSGNNDMQNSDPF